MRPSNLKLRSDKERIGKCSLEFLLHTQFTHSTIMGTIRVFCRHSVKTGNKSTMFRCTCTSQEMRPSNFKLTHDKESVGNVTWSPYWVLNLQTPPSTSHTDQQVGLKTVQNEDPNPNPVTWWPEKASFPERVVSLLL